MTSSDPHDSNPEIVSREIAFPSGEDELRGFLARPAAPLSASGPPRPGVVVIHEIYGLNDNIRSVAERFAGEGYVALAVDLFADRNRVVCMFRFMYGLLFDSLEHRGIRDLRAALDLLAAQEDVDAERLGAIGFCMGGSFAIAWACGDPRLKAIAPFYGMNPRPLEAVARCCPVVGSYPERDFTAGAARKLEQALERYEIPHDIVIYPGARHSFFNEHNPRTYDPAASADAWRRTLAFFGERL